MCAEVFHNLRAVLKSKGMNTAVGDEGGFAPDLASNADAIANIVEAVEKAGYVPGRDIRIALDVAATEIYDEKEKVYFLAEKELRRQRRRWLSIMPNCARNIRSFPSKTVSQKRTGRAGNFSPKDWVIKYSW